MEGAELLGLAAAVVALALVLVLLVAPLRSRQRAKRRVVGRAGDELSPERRARIEQFVR